MLDGPPCLKNGFCEAKYPKKYQRHTTYEKNFMPCYRRLKPEWGGHTAQVYCRRLGREVELDNRYVVPFNRHLLMKYKVRHIELHISLKEIAARKIPVGIWPFSLKIIWF